MAISETVIINDTKFTARRMTVREIREINEQLEAGAKQTILDLLFEDGLPSPSVLKSLDVELEALDNLEPEQIKELMEAVAKVNPIYAAMEKRLAAKINRLLSSSTGFAPG